MATEKEHIIKEVFQFTSARYICQAIGFFTAIAMRRFLGPFYMGIWSILKIILNYSSYLLMGVKKGTAYKIPFCVGQNNREEEENAKNTGFSFIFIVSVLTAIGLLGATIILRNKYPLEVIIGLCALSIYIILERICGYYMLLLRAKRNFSILSMSLIFDAVVNLLLIVLLVRTFRIYGLYITIILVVVLNTFFMHTLARYRVNFSFKLTKVFGLIKIGFPITIVGFLQGVLGSLDRIMIVKMIGITFVGYYSIPIMAKSYVEQLSSFGTVLFPRLLETYGKNQKIEDIRKYTTVPPSINAYILPAILGLLFFIIPLFVKKILPKFIPGVLAMQILLIDMFFLSCCTQAYHFIFAIKKQVRIIPAMAVAIMLNAAGNYILIKKGYGIYGVAWATSIVSFLIFITIQSYAMKHFARIKEILSFLVKIIIPFVYTALAVLLLEHFIIMDNIYVETTIKSSLLLIASLPMLFYINKETKVISLVFNMIKNKITKRGI